MKAFKVILFSTTALIILFYFSNTMKSNYKKEVKEALARTNHIVPELLLEKDIQHLPEIVQKYLRYSGAIGKEKIVNFRVEFDGVIRSNPGDPWMKLKSVQYNFTDKPTRIFYITARKMGVTASGIHLYKDEKAIMLIKLLGLFTIADAKGSEMNQGETVTVFNDMCFMAPATLIDKNIEWETVDSLTVNAKYTNESITIRATLFFNEKGELINFISNDRYETKDGKTYLNHPWVTPVEGYHEMNGHRLPTSAKAIYKHPEGDFCYGEFRIKKVECNVTRYK